MALTQQAIDDIKTLLATGTAGTELVLGLRKILPGMSVTLCNASDVDSETPVLETSGTAIYLIDTSEHCVRLTTLAEAATGLIVAEK